MPDIVIETEVFTSVLKDVIQGLYNFANSIVIEFCGVTFDLWDMFMAGLVVGLIALIAWGLSR